MSSSVGGHFLTLDLLFFSIISDAQQEQIECDGVVLGYLEIRIAAENKEEYMTVGGLAT